MRYLSDIIIFKRRQIAPVETAFCTELDLRTTGKLSNPRYLQLNQVCEVGPRQHLSLNYGKLPASKLRNGYG